MKPLFAILLFLAGTLPALADWQGKVIAITDGDTIRVLHDTQPEKIRLAEIDCPEKSQAFGEQAKLCTSRLCFGAVVTVSDHGRDRYGRTIADITLPDGSNLNRELVREGYAWQYLKYSHDPELAKLQAEAQASRRGLWQDPKPVAPWQFRHAQKMGRAR